MCPDRKNLSYRLREKVSCHQRKDDLVLVLPFPLTTMVLHRLWKPAFDLLASHTFVSFQRLVSTMVSADPAKIELFLNQLVRKGFLEFNGFSELPHYPSVSIIIPVKNRPEEIASCLQSLTNLDYPTEKIETLVVDDGSDDETPDVAGRFSVTLIVQTETKQASFCRNLAARRASGEILAFLDSDCLAEPTWLKELLPAFKDPQVGAVGGLVDSFYRAKRLDRYEQVMSSLKIASWFKSTYEADPFFYLPSCNLLIRRDLFLETGGFKESLHVGEDVDLCWRLRDGGSHLEYRPIGRVYHRHRNRIYSFCSRRFDYGSSEPLLQKLHKTRIKKIMLPRSGTLFWCALALSIFLISLPFLVVAGTVVFLEVLIKFKRIYGRRLPVAPFSLFRVVIREYLIFFYQSCTFFSRYYLMASLFVFPFFPEVSAIILGMHLLTGLVEFFIKKPCLSIPIFLFYFSLEQLSYQAGVWWGCFQHHFFKPINPQLVMSRSSE